jgi:hypothetical protein
MGDPDDLTELAEAIEQGRDAIEVPEALLEEHPPEQQPAKSLQAELQGMRVGERLKLALKGNRDVRTLLIRDANRMVQRFVLLNPRITDEEVLAIAKNRSVDRAVLEQVCRKKEWVSNYQVRLALTTNPKTPLGMAVRFVPTLLPRDLRTLAKSKNVPAAICSMAKRLVLERGG